METHLEQHQNRPIILFENDNLKDRAAELALSLNTIDIYPSNKLKFAPHTVILTLTENRLELQTTDRSLSPLFVDFRGEALQFRVRHGGRKKEMIARAIGLKQNKSPLIFDITAGLGRDAFILASLGCQVHLFERNMVIAALLADGLSRAKEEEPTGPASIMTLHQGDALENLSQIAQNIPPQVIYLDPMFPHRRKTALVKKEMRMLRTLVGDDPDASNLLREALKYATERVVCKRPKVAPYLSESPPNMSILSKKHRFDVYLTKRYLAQENNTPKNS